MFFFWIIPAMMLLNLVFYVFLGPKLFLLPWWTLVVAFFVVNSLDAHSTIIATRKFGIECEKNPIAKKVIRRFGWKVAVVLKFIILVSVLFFLGYDLPENRASLASLTVLFAIIAASNYFQFLHYSAENSDPVDEEKSSLNQGDRQRNMNESR